MSIVNPANAPEKRAVEKGRIPMSVPLQKLSVPDIPGYYLRWFVSSPSRVSQALRAGYEFVEVGEVDLNEVGISGLNGNADLGTRITVISGKDPSAGEGENHLILMKLKSEFREADLGKMDDNVEHIAATLRSGAIAGSGDNDNRYIPNTQKRHVASLFQRKH